MILNILITDSVYHSIYLPMTPSTHTHTHTHTHIYIQTHTHTHIHTHIYIHTHTHTLTETHTYTHLQKHTHTHTYTHIYRHTHIHTRIYTHIHTHIQTHTSHCPSISLSIYVIVKLKFVLFNDATGTHWFLSYHRLLDVIHTVTLTHFLEGNPLPPHRLLFSISSKGSFICTFPQTEQYIPRTLINQLWTTGWNGKYICYCFINNSINYNANSKLYIYIYIYS